ncbi:hotdog domain-containing protein [Dactylosporangium sp. NPDC051485]|uniref:acyl-CoA thioesterase n=1 Tax=Dactylosporangium sp. NPDC051485 TaxID=3154846 RepID=UPI00343C0AF5
MPLSDRDGTAMPEIHRIDLRLGYADCDPAQIIYYGAWFPWMERVQTEWLYLNDLRPDTLEERFGFRIVSRAAQCEYLSPARVFDRIALSLLVEHVGRTSLRWGFRMVRHDDAALVARAWLVNVTIGPVPVPEPMRSALLNAMVPHG